MLVCNNRPCLRTCKSCYSDQIIFSLQQSTKLLIRNHKKEQNKTNSSFWEQFAIKKQSMDGLRQRLLCVSRPALLRTHLVRTLSEQPLAAHTTISTGVEGLPIDSMPFHWTKTDNSVRLIWLAQNCGKLCENETFRLIGFGAMPPQPTYTRKNRLLVKYSPCFKQGNEVLSTRSKKAYSRLEM